MESTEPAAPATVGTALSSAESGGPETIGVAYAGTAPSNPESPAGTAGGGDSEPAGTSDECPIGDNVADVVYIPVHPKHLSPTSTAMLRQCPQRWKFRYVDRLPDPPGEAALAGTFAHRVLEALLNLNATERTQDRARSLATEFWPDMKADKSFIALDLDEAGVLNFKKVAWHAITGLWDLEDPTAVEIVGTETEVSVEIGGVPFYGFIDRVEDSPDGLVISDYKSGRAPSRRFSKDRLEQVLLYAAAIAELHDGTLPARARLMYLGQKIIETEVTAAGIEDVTRRLADTWEDLLGRSATGDFPPQPGPLCGWCAFVQHCPDGLAEVERRHRSGSRQPNAPALAEAG